MKIGVVGSRDFVARNEVEEIVDRICEIEGDMINPLTIVSGGARGVDTWAEEVAKKWEGLGVETLILKADWDKHGKKAGYLRNKIIVDNSDVLIAFWDGKSKGTKHSIDLAVANKTPINVYIRN